MVVDAAAHAAAQTVEADDGAEMPLRPNMIAPSEALVTNLIKPTPNGKAIPKELDVQCYAMKVLVSKLQSIQTTRLHTMFGVGFDRRVVYPLRTMKLALLQRSDLIFFEVDCEGTEWVALTDAAHRRLHEYAMTWPQMLMLHAVQQIKTVVLPRKMNLVHVLLGLNINMRLTAWSKSRLPCWGLGTPQDHPSEQLSRTALLRVQEYWKGVAAVMVRARLLCVPAAQDLVRDLDPFLFDLTEKGREWLLLSIAKFDETVPRERRFEYPFDPAAA